LALAAACATLCYMVNIEVARRGPDTVGVRELRQNLSIYLDRVKLGETLSVTEYGQVVAILAPLPAARLTRLERMVAEGRATPPTRSLRDLLAPAPGVPGAPASEDVIADLREERL
jgi:antitoxin (DNA-binding transcriptional repressor) of toxin-antitoxin stability system